MVGFHPYWCPPIYFCRRQPKPLTLFYRHSSTDVIERGALFAERVKQLLAFQGRPGWSVEPACLQGHFVWEFEGWAALEQKKVLLRPEVVGVCCLRGYHMYYGVAQMERRKKTLSGRQLYLWSLNSRVPDGRVPLQTHWNRPVEVSGRKHDLALAKEHGLLQSGMRSWQKAVSMLARV